METPMSELNRRAFLEGSLALTGAAVWANVAGGAPPSEKVNIAVLGCGRGAGLAQHFAALPECNVVAICDIDESRGQPLAQKISEQAGRRTEWVNDFLTLLDQKHVDAGHRGDHAGPALRPRSGGLRVLALT